MRQCTSVVLGLILVAGSAVRSAPEAAMPSPDPQAVALMKLEEAERVLSSTKTWVWGRYADPLPPIPPEDEARGFIAERQVEIKTSCSAAQGRAIGKMLQALRLHHVRTVPTNETPGRIAAEYGFSIKHLMQEIVCVDSEGSVMLFDGRYRYEPDSTLPAEYRETTLNRIAKIVLTPPMEFESNVKDEGPLAGKQQKRKQASGGPTSTPEARGP
ncbi:MAG: hypothetical protein KJ579_09895 [Verrucomicrobia bacterium]|nr:hypothetical protein [Verrucomicrobiota bacterium]